MQHLIEYETKLNSAKSADTNIEATFKANQEALTFLTKTKNELSAMIPESQSSKDFSQNPAIKTI
jgi:hypothetical protein